MWYIDTDLIIVISNRELVVVNNKYLNKYLNSYILISVIPYK
jgi:hypothetical protein